MDFLQTPSDQKPENLSDQSLYNLCQKYGTQALLWRQKFIGLLPEVNRRELYKKKGFSSIFEFAARLSGISREQVERVLGLERKFENLPILKKMLVNGEVSINKLARVSGIANFENQEFLADQTRLLSNRALETLVRDEKYSAKMDGVIDAEVMKNAMKQVVHVHGTHTAHGNSNIVKSDKKIDSQFDGKELRLSDEVKQKLLELQNKGIDVNEMILEFSGKREQEIAQAKEKLAEEEKQKLEHLQEIWKEENIKTSRHIPVKIKKLIEKEHGKKCSIPNCRKEWVEIHHTQRFSLSKTHDPRYMSPFCHEHHQIAHSIRSEISREKISFDFNGKK